MSQKVTPDAVFLVPTRCVGTWKLRAAESIRPVSTIRTTRESNLPAVRRYPVRSRGRQLWALPTDGDGVRKPSERRRSQPDWDRRHLVGPWDRRHLVGSQDHRYFVGPSGYRSLL